jgi:hypothetical protein
MKKQFSLRRLIRKNSIKSGGYNIVEEIMGFLLGYLRLFYPLLIASVIIFVIAVIKRSWIWMLVSAILLYPDAWYFSGYPPYPWVILKANDEYAHMALVDKIKYCRLIKKVIRGKNS